MAEENMPITPHHCHCQPNEPLPSAGNYYQFSGMIMPNKTSWPEVVGAIAEEARKKILEDMPAAQVHLLLPPYAFTQDLVSNRVRLFLDASGRVLWTPYIG